VVGATFELIGGLDKKILMGVMALNITLTTYYLIL
jgi:hypothetical protein